MLAHYNNIGSYNTSSYKERKSRRGNLTVTDEEVRAAMIWVRIQNLKIKTLTRELQAVTFS